jgi:hypothetical protein
VLEGMPDGTVMATVTLPSILPEPVNLTFSSDDPEAALPIPPVIQIPAGSISGSVAIRTPKNYFVDPQRSATITVVASGHDPDNAVLHVENVDGPYLMAGPGMTVTENFDGFGGSHDPAPWSTTGALPWQGIDDGSSSTPGLRAYGSAADSSLGFLPGGSPTVATATFVNDSDEVLTALDIAFDVEQWRGAFGGTQDTLAAELFYDGSSISLPALAYTASTTLPTGPVAGGAATPLSATAGGLSIPPGATFELRITFTPGSGGGVAPSDVFINEFHYDDPSTDSGEFIEVAVAPGFTGQPSEIDIVLYNGDTAGAGVVYDTLNLGSDFTPAGTFNGYSLYVVELPSNGIQNGPRDGFAVVNTAASQVLHFISYEGVFTASAGPATGLTSVGIGVDQDPVPAEGESSVGLTGVGGQASAFTWTQFTGLPYSAGQPNSGQTFSVPALPSQGIAIDNLGVTFLPASDPDTDDDGLANSLDPDDDNDTQTDADELAFGTDPLDAASIFRALLSPSGDQLSFPGATGIEYTVESSPDLAIWTELGTFVGNGQVIEVPIPGGEDRIFYRVRAGE